MFWTALCIIIIAICVAFILLKSSHYGHSKQKFLIILSIFVICISVGVYFMIGNIEYADQPYQKLKQREKQLRSLSTDDLIKRFEAALKQKDTPEARLILANALVRIGKIDDAKIHYKMAYQLDQGKTPKIMLAYAELLIVTHDKIVNELAFSILNNVLKIAPKNVKALFYKGLYYAQQGQQKSAIQSWQKMVANTLDIPYHNMFKQRLRLLIKQYNIQPSQVKLDM